MKKLFALILAGSAVFGLSACHDETPHRSDAQLVEACAAYAQATRDETEAVARRACVQVQFGFPDEFRETWDYQNG